MRIGLDIDGTITELAAFFAALTQAMTQAGHEIIILTSRQEMLAEATRQELATLGIAYSAIHFGVADKAALCQELGIECVFEDDRDHIVNLRKAGVAAVAVASESFMDLCCRLQPACALRERKE